ncbi:hypothetical protein SGPA1_11469 [Streptomyces misionensis JCM 4497]
MVELMQRSGERRLRLVCVDALHDPVLRGGSRQRFVLRLDPDQLGLQVLNALLQPSHLGEESRVGAADVTEKRLCHDGWSSTLSDRPMRCGS